jgi:hypothetical protein
MSMNGVSQGESLLACWEPGLRWSICECLKQHVQSLIDDALAMHLVVLPLTDIEEELKMLLC